MDHYSFALLEEQWKTAAGASKGKFVSSQEADVADLLRSFSPELGSPVSNTRSISRSSTDAVNTSSPLANTLGSNADDGEGGCDLCLKTYGLARRKQWCRRCGELWCGDCSTQREAVHELVPELYTCPDVLRNVNGLPLGSAVLAGCAERFLAEGFA